MPATITIPPGASYILVTFNGTLTRADALQFVIDSHALGSRSGLHRYLVDLRAASNQDTVSNNLSFAYEDMAGPTVDRSARVALLVSPKDRSHDFPEAAIRAAGLDVTMFTSWEDAERHLLGGASTP